MNETANKNKLPFFKERVYPVLFMLLVTIVFITAVSGLYLTTENLVLLNETLFLKRAVLYSANIPVPEEGPEIEALYNSRIREKETSAGPVFRIVDDTGNTEGWVVFSSGPGLWGEIEAVVGYDRSGKVLTGVEFVKQNETPGLGARITEPWFKEQFRSKVPPFIMVPEGTAKTADEMDAITGATRTSTAVLKLMNRSMNRAAEAIGEVR